ncbi:hypothetical protein [Thermogemmatispora sp.]|uniref:hypothetical protein n=1 Tax=Thermogemmatispora sp. TaxID=1968838 RepID=UPI001DD12491|nr:hypothetical protein [Thermogemmatispora sp.]MBX5450554.1 hypothetical protein [Thermogemmatispora sp.]
MNRENKARDFSLPINRPTPRAARQGGRSIQTRLGQLCGQHRHEKPQPWPGGFLVCLLLLVLALLTACESNTSEPVAGQAHLRQLDNGTIIYDSSSEAVLLRTFRGGGHLGTLDLSPQLSIYGDGTYILGPGLQMRQGRLSQEQLSQLLHTLVNSYRLLSFQRQQFYEVPDQDAVLLQFNVNNQHYQFFYSTFGQRQESQQDLDEYRRLGQALTTINEAVSAGSTTAYDTARKALLVRQDFSPDLSQPVPTWGLPDFTLHQVALFECGPVPEDITGPNADSGCLSFTTPQRALLLTPEQSRSVSNLLHGRLSGEFYEPATGLYYTVMLRALLPDELSQGVLAMYGSQDLTYSGVPLQQGPLPTATS